MSDEKVLIICLTIAFCFVAIGVTVYNTVHPNDNPSIEKRLDKIEKHLQLWKE